MAKESFPSPEAAGFIVSVCVVAAGIVWFIATPPIAATVTALVIVVAGATIAVLRSRGDF